MEQRLSLVTLGVGDLARARAFYEEGLGWRRGNTEDEVAFYQLPGIVLALWDRAELAADAGVPDAPPGFGGFALAYNTRSRDEVVEVLDLAREAGGTVTKPATDTEWGGFSGYFSDPDGHLWEVAFNPYWSVDEVGNTALGPADGS
ncbi:VOC family protein [Aeromicrobium sp. Leaf350]|uniref:VOC family protein n=1 Tax=Aeromicrobium sp. Leaf350 TaxID=2876565 RepID=UPI001E316818|nr:VOC family protein [Aeromicrobium sp. Leaf350]